MPREKLREIECPPVCIGSHEYHLVNKKAGCNQNYKLGNWECIYCGHRRIFAISWQPKISKVAEKRIGRNQNREIAQAVVKMILEKAG